MYQTKVSCFATSQAAISIVMILEKDYADWLAKQTDAVKNWLLATNYQGKAGQFALLADVQGQLQQVIMVLKNAQDWLAVGALALQLPERDFSLMASFDDVDLDKCCLAWGMGAYQYTRYKKAKRASARLVMPANVNQAEVMHQLEAIYLVRDLINTPAQDCMPQQLAVNAKELAQKFNANFHEIVGEELLAQNYPCIYHVGKGSVHVPRLIELNWGNAAHPKVTLVGKGVCFDSGGLDLKPASGMAQMKKDMGGAAHVLGLAYRIMSEKLPVRLRVLIPAVENAISGSAYHPGDVLTSRAGKTIEIGNTDAEGRLVLCDALTAAVSEKPEALIDFATLTGAARIAVGTEIAAFFTNQQAMIAQLMQHSENEHDACWPLPLFSAYRSLIDSKIADINNAGTSSYAGAITAALFLQEFVPPEQTWFHFDVMAWNVSTKPGKPEGAEAMGVHAMYALLKEKFKK